jgi:hypothetical protein
MTSTLGRREFLRFGAVGAAALATLGCGVGRETDDAALARPELLAALGERQVRAIGAQYRAQTPSEGDTRAIHNAIHGSRPLRARLFGGGPSLDGLIRDDFSHGRTAVIDGWVLSVTEARQCALFSLLVA